MNVLSTAVVVVIVLELELEVLMKLELRDERHDALSLTPILTNACGLVLSRDLEPVVERSTTYYIPCISIAEV